MAPLMLDCEKELRAGALCDKVIFLKAFLRNYD